MAEQDTHTTGRAWRRRPSDPDIHDTTQAVRRRQGQPEPFKTGSAHRAPKIQSPQIQAGTGQWPDEFKLDGVEYKNDGVLSDSSGEAIIFTVSRRGKKYALKIYYYDPNHRPNHAILEKISQLGGSGLLVNIVSHGQWINPLAGGESNDYELMDFCEGGSMDGEVLAGDEKRLSEVAVRMASAIDFLSRHGILHRDIKPANFFYADAAKTQIVLGDFGISVACQQGMTVKIDEMRSPVYAAPEFYVSVPGEPAEVSTASDYFSLGVSLLCLWMGKARLTANENQLLKQKMTETLPTPKGMSEHTASLIKALTKVKVNERADFEAVKRWVKGETLEWESEPVETDFRVVFNSTKNQVAHSCAELAHYLIEDKALGKKYLYSGRITRWLEAAGANEIAVNVEEVVEKIYPQNQEAGLMTAYYMLDPAAGYIAPDGRHFTDPKEISMHLHTSRNMGTELLDKDSNLMIYLKALKMDNLVSNLRSFIDNLETSEWSSYFIGYYLAVLLNPRLSFPLMVGNKIVNVDSIMELLEALSKTMRNLGEFNRIILHSEALIVWLATRDAAVAGKIRMLHDKSSDDPQSPYYHSSSASRIVYELDPRADLNLSTGLDDTNRTYTPEEIGRYLNNVLSRMVKGQSTGQEFEDLFVNMKDSMVGHFLRSRGKDYMRFLSWSEACMDVDNSENSQKAGPYDKVIGAYKMVAGFLGHAPSYPLGGRLISSPDHLGGFGEVIVKRAIAGKDRPMPVQGKTLPWLDAWLAVCYQENPKLDLSEKFTYEKTTAEYMDVLATYAPDAYYVARYLKALATIDVAAGEIKTNKRKLLTGQLFCLLLCGLSTVAMILGGLLFGTPDVNPLKGHFWDAVGIFFIVFFVIDMVVMLVKGLGFLVSLLIAGRDAFVNALVYVGMLWVGFRWMTAFTPKIVAVILVVAASYYIYDLFKVSKSNTGGKTIRGDEFEYRQLDALYYAYRQTDDGLDSVVTNYAKLERDNYQVNSAGTFNTSFRWALIVLPLFAIWIMITPQISGRHSWPTLIKRIEAMKGQWAVGTWKARYRDGNTQIVCNIDSVADGTKIYGTMVIAGQAPVAARGEVTCKYDTLPGSFHFWAVEQGGKYKRAVRGNYSHSKKEMSGNYCDRNSQVHQLEFTSTPLPVEENEAVQ